MKILVVSLGCDKNLVDSEVMMGLLQKRGHCFTDNEFEADIIIVNTCGFINDAKEESINTILSMAEHKKDKCKALIVTGCLAQRYRDQIMEELPEIDAVLGTTAYDEICEVIDSVMEGHGINAFEDVDRLVDSDSERVISTGGYFSYLKIAEGCNKRCTYCAIPYIRGNYRSVKMDKLISEATYLAANGVKELIIVAQETTLYGVDLYGKKMLPELLSKLCEIEGIQWIRLLYCYPEEITDELIAVIKKEKKICHYIDMPIQHASDNILKKMGRRTTHKDLVEIISKLRHEIPDIALRTTLITGFPGESEEDFRILKDFVEEIKFERLGVFTYSAEEDTPAAAMPDQIDEDIKASRRDEIMELQQDISYQKSQEMIGKRLEVMIEGRVDNENAYAGRTYMDAPDVDGYIFINTDEDIISGSFAYVNVTGAMEYDLIGELD